MRQETDRSHDAQATRKKLNHAEPRLTSRTPTRRSGLKESRDSRRIVETEFANDDKRQVVAVDVERVLIRCALCFVCTESL